MKVNKARRALPRRVGLLVSCLATFVACGTNGTSQSDDKSNTGVAKQAATTPPDYRVPTPDQVRLGAARGAVICRKQKPQRLGLAVTGAVQFAARFPSFPDSAASELACALQAPKLTTCDALDACAHVRQPLTSQISFCDGNDVIGIAKGKLTARVHCKQFGEQCFDTDIGAVCSQGPCASGETYVCDGDVAEACVQGYKARTRCGRGRTCGARADGILDCIGAGPSCSGPPSCSGTVAHNCVMPPGAMQGTDAQTDCAAFGLICAVSNAGSAAVCVPRKDGCNPETDKAYCKGTSINICVAGNWWSTPCSTLGALGLCAKDGMDGEATCL